MALALDVAELRCGGDKHGLHDVTGKLFVAMPKDERELKQSCLIPVVQFLKSVLVPAADGRDQAARLSVRSRGRRLHSKGLSGCTYGLAGNRKGHGVDPDCHSFI